MRELVAEFTGSALLLAAVVGSGIMGDRLAAGNTAIALLANTLATGAALVALILTFGPISGAHFNPAVSFADASQRGLTWRRACSYSLAQIAGAIVGVGAADFMFEEPVYSWSRHVRSGLPQVFSEAVATFGLLAVIWGCSRRRPAAIPFGVGAYITAAYWFTASTSFANPAVTIARSLTDTFAGIRPNDVLPFIVAQGAGAGAATILFRWLAPAYASSATSSICPSLPHHQSTEPVGGAMTHYNVLFLCTGNSARSIMAEALLNYWGKDRFHAYSAGSHPKGEIHPMALEILSRNRLPTDALRSKSWEEFATPDAPPLNFVFTVCDRAAQEMCPVWPGQPMTAHWGIEDPAAAHGTDAEIARAFIRSFRELDARIKIFTSLRIEALDRLSLQRQLDAIGRAERDRTESDLEISVKVD